MPRRDGTGPNGLGSMTGRGAGLCGTGNSVNYGLGTGQRLGLNGGGRGRRFSGLGLGLCRYYPNSNYSTDSKEILLLQKRNLEKEIELIDKQIENLK
ncbi:MAG: DUF5320 domain-containing protein [Bacilli bacterium]|nr:DUF5320 domain-containing protein [Bacilli bacterium]